MEKAPKTHLLAEDQSLQNKIKNFFDRPLSHLKSLVIVPLLAITLQANGLTNQYQKNQYQENQYQKNQDQKNQYQKNQYQNLQSLILDIKTNELPTSTQKTQEEERYRNILEHYRQNPTPLKTILTHIWQDLGLSKKEAENIIEQAFQNPNLTKTDLNKPTKFFYAEKDLLQKNTLDGLKNYLSSQEYAKRVLPLMLDELNLKTNTVFLPYETFQKALPGTAHLAAWQHIQNLSRDNPTCLQILDTWKNNLDLITKEKIVEANGWAIPGDNIFILKDTIPAKTLFRYILPHEATHTGQKNIDEHLLQTIATLKEDYLTSKRQNPLLDEYLKKNPEKIKQLTADFDYLTNPHEIAAWSGVIKKIYFEQTKRILTNRSPQEEYKKFSEWLHNATDSEPTTQSQIETFRTLKRFFETSPKTQKLLWDHLKDVAKKPSNPKQETPQIC